MRIRVYCTYVLGFYSKRYKNDILCREPRLNQAFKTKPNAIGKTNTPEPLPRAIRTLDA